jgi:transglutaminase-like putative cysteine protease
MTSSLLLAAIPVVYDRASSWALQLLDDRVQVGFHDGPMSLGSLEGMLDSDEVVLRITGDVGERLRGNAYSDYADGVWRATLSSDPGVTALADAMAGEAGERDEAAVIRYARGEGDRFFLPLEAEAVRSTPSQVRIDPYGIARPADKKVPEEARVQLGSRRRLAPAPPGVLDRSLPDVLRPALEEIATDWTREATTPLARVRALQKRLESDYQYSLHFERREGADALLQFLRDDRQGHCEYFASALALLARASGVPARMVTGYRVSERNSLGDYWIVRERHAHAWVEVHLADAGWVAVDASPIRGFEGAAARTTAWGPGLFDWVRVELQQRGPTPLLAVLLVVFGGIQLRGLLSERKRRRAIVVPPVTPGFLTELLTQLHSRGWGRAQSETLEALARRLPLRSESQQPVPGADALLARVAALRYGGQGSPQALAHDIRRWIRNLG